MRPSKCCSPAPLTSADRTSPLAVLFSPRGGVAGPWALLTMQGSAPGSGCPSMVLPQPCLPAWTTEQKQISFPHMLKAFPAAWRQDQL